eukprot:TRINITY_DN14924_c0_g1_i1.p1 TRINITY_DN14924_c0_g1~~TRINITY_DN14924_c0_g1_i1.p1  ORF type:complete len:225 (+),score=22.45 TRINITY_DN14924_c0_g1_i1:58-732(+)
MVFTLYDSQDDVLKGRVPFLPPPRKELICRRTPACFLWAAQGVCLSVATWAHLPLDASGMTAPEKTAAFVALASSVVHIAYFATFSLTNLAIQVRVFFFLWVLLAFKFVEIRFLVYSCLAVVCWQDALMRYNFLERFLFLLPVNRPESTEELSIDYVLRVFSQKVPAQSDKFSVRNQFEGAEHCYGGGTQELAAQARRRIPRIAGIAEAKNSARLDTPILSPKV